jgi:hypothetical protein
MATCKGEVTSRGRDGVLRKRGCRPAVGWQARGQGRKKGEGRKRERERRKEEERKERREKGKRKRK